MKITIKSQTQSPYKIPSSLPHVSAVLPPAGCVPPRAHSGCQGEPSVCGCLQRDNTVLATLPKVSVMSGPWIRLSSLRTCFAEVCISVQHLRSCFFHFSGNLAPSFVSTWEESLGYSLPPSGSLSVPDSLCNRAMFSLKAHTDPSFPVLLGVSSLILSLPFPLCSSSCSLFPSQVPGLMLPWPLSSSYPHVLFSAGFGLTFSLLLCLFAPSPQAFSWTLNYAVAGKNLLTCLIASAVMLLRRYGRGDLSVSLSVLSTWTPKKGYEILSPQKLYS